MNLFELFRRFKYLRPLLFRLAGQRSEYLINLFAKDILGCQRIIDIGAGGGNITYDLRQKGYAVTPVDIKNLSFNDSVLPELYDGKKLPYGNKQFDAALLITVLHHCQEPEAVLAEAKRVAQKVIIVEDIYKSRTQKYLTFFFDNVFNLEIFNNPHNNKTDAEWKTLFKNYGLELERTNALKAYKFFHHKLYVLTS